MSIQRIARRLGRYAIVLAVTVFVITPFYWLIVTSLRPANEMLMAHPSLLPSHVTLDNYKRALSNPRLGTYLLNSTIVSVGTTLLALGIAVLAAYALSRFPVRFKSGAEIAIFVSQMLPPIILVVPLFFIWNALGWYDTLWALIMSNLIFKMPVLIWLLLPTFEGFPKDLEDAATVDGCTAWGVLFRIFLPVCAPALAAGSIYTFIFTWNEYLFALVFTESVSARVLTIGIKEYFGQHVTDWGGVMATSAILTVPVIVLFLYLQKHLVKGLLAGALKG